MDKMNLRRLVAEATGKIVLMKQAHKISGKYATEEEFVDAFIAGLHADGWNDEEIEIMLDAGYGTLPDWQYQLPLEK